jgi:hypothetical protein
MVWVSKPAHKEDTMSTLIELNALRVANNMKPLKRWAESKAKLDAAVAKLSGITPAEQALKASVEVTKVPTGMTAKKLEAAKAKEAKAAAKPKGKTAKEGMQKTIVKDGKTVKSSLKAKSDNILATVCGELEIDPKVARAKLRREFGKKEDGKWPTIAKAMTDFLSGDKRKKD